MTTYIYAVCDNNGNRIKSVNAPSMESAKEKIIDIYRDKLELDEEFDTWSEFIDFMWERGINISYSIYDIETL